MPGVTSINQVQSLLGDEDLSGATKGPYNEATFIKTMNMKVNEIDPANISLLNEVLDTLKYKNGN